jgi:hypothetical protein
MLHAPVAFQGGRILEGADLYRALNRGDLATAYESRVAGKVALELASLGALLAGGLVIGTNTPDTQCGFAPQMYPFQPPQVVCQTNEHSGARDVGIGLLVLAPILMIAGVVIDAEPVSPLERQQLIDTFNASLPPGTAEASPLRSRAAVSFTAAPAVSANGASLILGASF